MGREDFKRGRAGAPDKTWGILKATTTTVIPASRSQSWVGVVGYLFHLTATFKVCEAPFLLLVCTCQAGAPRFAGGPGLVGGACSGVGARSPGPSPPRPAPPRSAPLIPGSDRVRALSGAAGGRVPGGSRGTPGARPWRGASGAGWAAACWCQVRGPRGGGRAWEPGGPARCHP